MKAKTVQPAGRVALGRPRVAVPWSKQLCAIVILGLALPASAGVRAWFAPSASKILRDAKPGNAPKHGELAAARNEDEACQLVLLADTAVKDVRVSASPLKNTRGKGMLKPTLFKVEYVPNIVGDTPYPDPLPPLTPFDLAPNQAQPVWISVRVPKDATPGIYRGWITVDLPQPLLNSTRKPEPSLFGKEGPKRGAPLQLPVEIRVWDFALPDTPAGVTAFGISPEWIARCHGVEAGSPKLKELHRKYYAMLLDHKLSPFVIPVDLMDPEAVGYLSDPRMTSFMIPYVADDAEQKKIIDRLLAGGWFAKGYFYPIDEPNSKEAYERFNRIVERLRKIEPQYRLVTPFFCNPDYDPKLTAYQMMVGKVNVWCPESALWDNVNIWTPAKDPDRTLGPLMAARKSAGESVWWYVCCGPGAPYNNFFVQMSAMSHRTLFWNQKRVGVQGLLYWSTTWWNPAEGCDDPWKSMQTLKSINAGIRGDGSLLYPGKPVGIDGPVSSLRLEVIRDGTEDFDYLALAEQRLGPSRLTECVAQVAKSLTEHEPDPMRLEKVRRELGAELEKATVEARRKL